MKTKFLFFILAILTLGGMYAYQKNTQESIPSGSPDAIIPEEIIVEENKTEKTEIISAAPKENDKKTVIYPTPPTPFPLPPKTEAPSPIACKKAVAATASPLNTNNLKEGLTTVIDESYYSIFGSNSDHIFKEILACAPEGTNGQKEVGNTSYRINIAYSWQEGSGICSLNNAKVGLHIVYTMPQWERTASASSEAIARWEKFLSNLWIHERTHGQNALEGAEKILSYLQNYTESGTCSNVGQTVQSKFESIEKEIRDKDTIFDSNPENRVRW